jgi:hypothetical protein
LLSRQQSLNWQAEAAGPETATKPLQIRISDYSGKVVLTDTYQPGDGLREYPVSTFESGMYFFEAIGEGQNARARFIVF